MICVRIGFDLLFCACSSWLCQISCIWVKTLNLSPPGFRVRPGIGNLGAGKGNLDAWSSGFAPRCAVNFWRFLPWPHPEHRDSHVSRIPLFKAEFGCFGCGILIKFDQSFFASFQMEDLESLHRLTLLEF